MRYGNSPAASLGSGAVRGTHGGTCWCPVVAVKVPPPCHQQTVRWPVVRQTHLSKQGTEIWSDCSHWEVVADDSWDVCSYWCVLLNVLVSEGWRRTGREGEGERDGDDRSFVKAPFICENGRDASHYQRVCDGCLRRGNCNLRFRLFYFRNERKKEQLRDHYHNDSVISTSLYQRPHISLFPPHCLSPSSMNISCFCSTQKYIPWTSHSISCRVLNSQRGLRLVQLLPSDQLQERICLGSRKELTHACKTLQLSELQTGSHSNYYTFRLICVNLSKWWQVSFCA